MKKKSSLDPKVAVNARARFKKGECGSAVDGPADDELAELSKALGHPARVRILRFLASQESCICGEIVSEISLAQSTVSQHLKVLKDAGLIRGEIDGPRTCYGLDPRGLKRLKALLAGLA